MNNWQRLENEPTISLINYLKGKSEIDDKLHQNAFIAFYFRFQGQVLKKCEIICKIYGYGKETAVLIAQETFERFLKYPNYNHEKSKCSDIDKGVILYLFRISEHCLFNYYYKRNGINVSPYNGTEAIIYEYPNIGKRSSYNTIEAVKYFQIIKEALDSLSPKHKIIYLTYKQFETSGHTLPRELLSRLREKLELKQATVRSYKNEAYNKVTEYLKIHGIKERG
jgi:hypothetical protein